MKFIIGCIIVFGLSGCTGIVTGHVYTAEEIQQIRGIAKDVYKDAKYLKEDVGK